MIETALPATDGYWMPAEFAPHHAGYLIWPERPDNWREGGKPAQRAFVQLATTLSRFQQTTVLVSEAQYRHARQVLPAAVRVVEMSNNDAFIKDTGPFFLVNRSGQVRGVNFQFNAWGGLLDGLYFPWDKDNEIANKLLDLLRLPAYQSETVLEGCSIVVDGEGTLIATEEVVLSEGRNPQMTKAKAEALFKTYLGIKQVIWLQEGFFMDETGGDVDNMVSFVRPGEVVLSWTDDPNDPQYASSHAAFSVLNASHDAKGRRLTIHKLPIPPAMTLSTAEANGVDPINGMLPRNPGQRLTATYVNYITTDQAILLPKFGISLDQQMQARFAELYPTREIVGIPVREFLTGGGGLHTLVLNVPTGQAGGE